MAFSFGQSSAFGSSFFATSSAASTSPGLFKTSSTPSFGATTAAFGASSSAAPAASPFFGATAAASSSAFSFGGASTPAFGASSTSLFGASSSPGLFGNTTTTAFGASSSPGLFGNTTSSAFGTGASPFSFNSQPAGGLFSNPATTTALTPFQPAGNSLGPQSNQLQVQATRFLPVTAPDVARNELTSIYNAYDANSPSYRFKTLFLNRVDNPAQRVKPAVVDEHRWQQALKEAGGPNNQDKLWPVLALGFKDLVARAAVQGQAVAENRARLTELKNLAHMMARKHGEVVKERSERMQDKHRELIQRLLHVWRLLDALEARRGANAQLGPQSELSKEAVLRQQLADLAAQLSPTLPGGLYARLEDVGSSARLRASGGTAMDVDSAAKLDQESVAKLFGVLQEHVAAVKHLQHVLHTDQLDVKIMKSVHGLDNEKVTLTLTPARS